MIKRIGILTSGGDSPGMNAAIRAVTKVGLNSGLEVFGIYNGYKGMVEGYIEPLTRESIGEIVTRGGTILGSARLPEFKDIEVREKAIRQLRKRGIEAVVVIGGDGSYRGALELTHMGINCIDFREQSITISPVRIIRLVSRLHLKPSLMRSINCAILQILIIAARLLRLWVTAAVIWHYGLV